MNSAKEVIINELTEKARQRFLEIEQLVKSHRAANRIPTLAATDIYSEAKHLLDLIIQLNRIELNDAPKIDESLD